jgi:hypothetical protein
LLLAAILAIHSDNCETLASIEAYNMAIKYISFVDPITGSPRIGDYDESSDIIKPLLFLSGTPVSSLYQAIEAGENRIRADGDALPYSKVKVLAPLTGRDILCVGKNYSEHAKEFNSSGYDSSDKVDIPTHPVIFTKRSTSIIAHGEEILPHGDFTKTADYEGEIGVIIGKAGYRISENEAMDYVWGYTIINDMTARERQRDHKQFYIGKSPDTFCPMVCERSLTLRNLSNCEANDMTRVLLRWLRRTCPKFFASKLM